MPLLTFAVAVLAAAAAPPDITIEHPPASCVLAGVFPKVTACVTARTEIGAPRVYFRGQGDARWYYVEMAWDGACFAAALPKPERGLRKLDYYVAVQAVAPPFAQAQTRVASPEVKTAAEGCGTPFLTEAKVRAIPTEGEPRVPAGFARDGLQGLPPPARKIGGGAVLIAAGVAAATTLAAGTAIVVSGPEETPTAAPSAAPSASPTPRNDAPERTPTATPPPGGTPEPTAAPTAPPPPPTTLPPVTLPPTTLPPLPTLPLADEPAPPPRPFTAVSSLEAPGACGQIVFNGTDGWMPCAGTLALNGILRAGVNTLELHVVDTHGEGVWRLTLAPATRVRRGSWRIVAGDVLRVEPHGVVLRVRARDDRALVSFEID